MTGRLVLDSEALHALFHTPSSLRRSVDALLVATAMEAAPGVVLTSDVEDLTRLAAPYGQITVSPLLVL